MSEQAAQAKSAAQSTEEPQKPEAQPQLEEDDEFEEFDSEEWTEAAEDPDTEKLWEDSWDDDNVTDDFMQALRAELGLNASAK